MVMRKNIDNIFVLFVVGLACLIYGAGCLYIAMHVDVIGIAILWPAG